jgi:sulfatase maturation enzyme AslB (radical SAM superfamily)
MNNLLLIDDVQLRAAVPLTPKIRPESLTARPLYKHDHKHPTRRGWLFMGVNGGPCDKACKMCYYSFQDNLVFYDLNTLIARANMFRHYYNLQYCDISGGEATIYGPKSKDGRRPQLEALIHHCRNIGLLPTIITHGQNNTAELVKGVEDAGLEDWLISLHGMESGHDNTVVDHRGRGSGGWQRLTDNLAHCHRPVRFNTTLQNFNYQELPTLARWLSDHREPTVWNMIQFNPFFAWSERPEIDFQSPLRDLAPFVGEAVQIAEAAGWEVNVRYFPFCVAAEHGFARNCINFYQTQYDPWEWALEATNRVPAANVMAMGGAEKARRLHCDQIAASRANDACNSCRFRPICEGPTGQYQGRFGIDELRPVAGQPITDIAHFEKGGVFA